MIVEQRPGKMGSGAFGYWGVVVITFWAEETAGTKALQLLQRDRKSCRINHCV